MSEKSAVSVSCAQDTGENFENILDDSRRLRALSGQQCRPASGGLSQLPSRTDCVL